MLVAQGLAAPIDRSKVDKSALTRNQLGYSDYAAGSNTLSYVMHYNTQKWPGNDRPKT